MYGNTSTMVGGCIQATASQSDCRRVGAGAIQRLVALLRRTEA